MSSVVPVSAAFTMIASPWMPIPALMGSTASVCLGNSLARTLFPVLGITGMVTHRVTTDVVILLVFWRLWRLHLSCAGADRIVLYGVAPASMNLLFYLSLQRLPVGITIAIEFVGLLALAVLSSRRALDFVWIRLAVVGLLTLTVVDKPVGQVDHLGVVYTLTAGVCWALYTVTGKNLGSLYAGQVTSLGMVVGALFTVPLGVAQAGSALFVPSLILVGFGIRLLSSATLYSLEMAALRHLLGKTFSVLFGLEPVIGVLAGAIVLYEQLTGRQWVAILAIVAALAGCALTVRAPKPSPNSTDVA